MVINNYLYLYLKRNNVSIVLGLFLISLLIICYLNLFNVSQPLLEEHSFRQTQTALTAYYLKLNGFKINYETPVVGEPWSIPFEFPIYQYIVAIISKITNIQLSIVGRLVNLFFIIFCTVPIYYSMRLLEVNRSAIHFSLILFLTSPVYLFWAGTFMIEGCALFMTLSFLYFNIKIIINRNCGNIAFIMLSIFILIGALQKITTIIPVILYMAPLTFYIIIRNSSKINNFKVFLKYIAAISLPIIVAIFWTYYTDLVKSENLIGIKLTSNALTLWNFGTLNQRFGSELWDDVILYRTIWNSSFSFLGILSISYVLFYLNNIKVKIIICSLLTLFFLHFLIFTNLHIVHNYYQTSNVVYLSLALGISLYYLTVNFFGAKSFFLPIIILVFILSNLYNYKKVYYEKKLNDFKDHRTIILGDYINKNTNERSIVIWIGGYDWSSEVAYYSERKSLTVPAWSNYEFEAIKYPEKFLTTKPAAYVLCPSPQFLSLNKEMLNTYPTLKPYLISGCNVYFTGYQSPLTP